MVVSACFSGHWRDELKAANTLVMTASRKDRPAMGCGEDSEMTWFTRALYDEADSLSLATPEELFQKASARIREWEKEKEMSEDEYAKPQFHLGDEMKQYLERFRKAG